MTTHRARAVWLIMWLTATTGLGLQAAGEFLFGHVLSGLAFGLVAWFCLALAIAPSLGRRLSAEDQAAELAPLCIFCASPNCKAARTRNERDCGPWTAAERRREAGVYLITRPPQDPVSRWQHPEDSR